MEVGEVMYMMQHLQTGTMQSDKSKAYDIMRGLDRELDWFESELAGKGGVHASMASMAWLSMMEEACWTEGMYT